MNSYAVYSKTGKGVQEAGGKTNYLPRAERAVLAAIDGRLTVEQLREHFPKSSEESLHTLLEHLEKDGYIRLVVTGQSSSQSARLSTEGAAPPDAGADLDFSAIAPVSGSHAAPAARSEADTFAKARAEAEARAQSERDAERERERAAERARYGPSKEELAAEAAAKAARAKAAAEAAVREKVTAEAREKAAATAKARAEVEARVRAQSEIAMKAAAEARAKAQVEAEAKLKATREAAVRAAVEAKLRAEAEANARLEAERRAREDLERRLKELERRLATETARPAPPVDRGPPDPEALRRQLDELLQSRGADAAPPASASAPTGADLLARRQAEELRLKLDFERRTREGEEARQRAEAEALLQKLDAERRAREEAEARQRVEAEALLRKLEAERRAREEDERRVRELEEARRRAEAEALVQKLEAERRAREEEERRMRLEEEARRRAEAEAIVQKIEAERKEHEERERKVREEVERRLREEAEARERIEAEALQQKLETERRAHEEEERRARDEENARRRKAEDAARRVEEEREAKLRAVQDAEERKMQAEAERIRQDQERAMREADELMQRKEAERQKALEEAERRKRKETQALFSGLNEFAGSAPTPAAHPTAPAQPAQGSPVSARTEPDLDFSGVAPAARETVKPARVEEETHRASKSASAPAAKDVTHTAPSTPAAEKTDASSSRTEAKGDAKGKQSPSVAESGLKNKVGKWTERFARKGSTGDADQGEVVRQREDPGGRNSAPAPTPRPVPKEYRAPVPPQSAETVRQPHVARSPRSAPVKWGSMLVKGVLAVVVLAVAGIHVVPVPVDSVESDASQAFGTSVKIASARWWLLTGPELRFSDVKFGDRGAVPLVRVVLRVEELASGKFVPERLEIEGASFQQAGLDTVIFGAVRDGRLRGLRVLARDTKFPGPLVLPSVNADVLIGADGRVQSATLRGADELLVKVSIRGREVTLDATGGKLAVPFLPAIELTDFSFKGTSTAQGINIREWDGRLLDGVIRGSARISWGAGWSVTGDIGAKAINASRFAPALVSEGRSVGQGTYSLSASRIGDLAASARLQGRFEVGRARLAGLDLMRALESGGAQVAGSMMLEGLKGDFIYERGAASLKNISIDASNDIRASGSLDISADGALRGSFAVARPLSRGGVQQTSINLGGTIREPKPQP